jgi:hypothetical protein
MALNKHLSQNDCKGMFRQHHSENQAIDSEDRANKSVSKAPKILSLDNCRWTTAMDTQISAMISSGQLVPISPLAFSAGRTNAFSAQQVSKDTFEKRIN